MFSKRFDHCVMFSVFLVFQLSSIVFWQSPRQQIKVCNLGLIDLLLSSHQADIRMEVVECLIHNKRASANDFLPEVVELGTRPDGVEIIVWILNKYSKYVQLAWLSLCTALFYSTHRFPIRFIFGLCLSHCKIMILF